MYVRVKNAVRRQLERLVVSQVRTECTHERIVTYDLTRILALFFVVSCHFFMHGDYEEVNIIGTRLFFMTGVRALSLTCVPLFLLTTGCVMRRKTLCGKYYTGLFRIVTIYVLASAMQLLLRSYVLRESIPLRSAILQILGYGADYGWYVEMYFGLFLLIPFLNILYDRLDRRQKRILILTMLLLTALPGAVNIFNFEMPGWWANPTITYMTNRLVPEYWITCYPITYYFIGCYYSEYPIRMNRWLHILLLLAALLLMTVLSYCRSYNMQFVWGDYQSTGAALVVAVSFLLFAGINGVDMQGMPDAGKKTIAYISNLSLGAYLLSGFFDRWLYAIPSAISENRHGMLYYCSRVPLVFACSLALSAIVYCVYQGLNHLIFKRIQFCFIGTKSSDKQAKQDAPTE